MIVLKQRKIPDEIPPFSRFKYIVRATTLSTTLEENYRAKGISLIYGLPFNLYVQDHLETITGQARDWTYRIHKPISVEESVFSISPNVPFKKWPAFEWSPNISVDNQIDPPERTFIIRTNALQVCNGIRIDVWGPSAELEAKLFTNRFFEWLRFLSGQVWINSYEFHQDSPLKYEFNIDEVGRAEEQPKAVREFTTSSYDCITTQIWQDAFHNSIQGKDVLTYWLSYQEAHNSFARGNLSDSLLSLVLSIEIARNINFQRFCKYTERQGIITFKEPFNNTDLRKNLGINLKNKLGKSLEEESKILWDHFCKMYTARHLIAHGKPGFYKSEFGFEPLHDNLFKEWLISTYSIIKWIESL